ncbi:PAS domain S-box protein [Vacuolonema iberomarrocanum]|uniref:PAS domain S-box protein n=1 Tax=Vacuolonema iberomarrocanum TaxID=3454632 RepID=UPI0019EA41C3|nr:PAS domain S-box protein [filamentous cyanobacterium LEGE 07170]
MRILVVEDDGITAEALSSLLGDQNYAVDVAQTYPTALELVEAFQYDLVLLDVQLPQGDGISLCRQLRSQEQSMPILMLTAQGDGHDKAVGLDAGADDYVVKPFHPEELSARVRALLRRGSGVAKPVLEWAGLKLKPSSCEVSYDGQLLTLTPKEYALLELFLRNHRRVFSCGVILEQIWSFEEMPGEEAVRTHIKGLRQKLKQKGAPADLVETVYGIGYRLKPQAEPEPEEVASPTEPAADDTKQKTLKAVAEIWERFKDRVFGQVQVVERAVTASLYGELNDALCQQARREAHSLAGSLGTFGFPAASKMARKLEKWLVDGAMTHPPSASRMVELVRSLRETLNSPVAGPSELPGVIKTTPVKVDVPIDPSDHLMVVDDDPLVLAAVRSLLEPWGLQVTTLEDPRNLWDTLDAATPSLLILDIEMPHENGITLCQQVRDHERWGGLPVMILTAHSDAGMVNQVFAAGADDFVTKPIVGPELVSRILHRLERMRLWRRFAKPQAPQPQNTVAPNEEMFHLLVDGVKDYAIYMLDPNGTIVSWNRGAEKIKGYTAEEILGTPFASFYLPEEREQNLHEIDLAIARRDGRCERIGERIRKGGACFWGDVVITALQDDDGTLRGYAVVTRDITDRKQLDDALQKSRGQLEVRVAERTAELVGVNERLRQELEERKRTQDALRISKARFAGILDIADDAIISIDVHQIITLFNQGAEKIFGYTAQEVMGQNLGILLPHRYGKIHRGYMRQFARSDGAARRMGDRREIYGRRKDGSEFPAEASISKLEIGDEVIFTVILRDISLRKASQERLSALSHQNELILNAMGEGICGVDLQGCITFVNPAAVNFLGYGLDELIGQSIQVILTPMPDASGSDLDTAARLELALHNGSSVQQGKRATFWRKDHTSLPVEYMSTPIHEQIDGRSELVGSVITFKDVTERQVVERMKDEFVSVVSHELRTPLTSIHGSLGMLASGMLDSDPVTSKRLLEIAVTSTERLVRLINDILDVERIESGKVKMRLQPCDAAELVSRAVDVMQPMAEQANIALEVKADAIALHADPDRVLQTLTNLLSNAIKFSEAGSAINITSQPVQLTEAGNPTRVEFAVSDRGRGIPEDKLETIFERFQQVDASDSRNQEGTGLGLAICRNIVQQHHGEISVKSALGEGSRFAFWLPLQPETEPSESTVPIPNGYDAKNSCG